MALAQSFGTAPKNWPIGTHEINRVKKIIRHSSGGMSDYSRIGYI
jgi:hypothetical protein